MIPGTTDRRRAPNARFVFGTEHETLTAVAGGSDPLHTEMAASRFLRELRRLAPSVSTAGGLFNAYGRVYLDIGSHLEFASIECDCPYQLALLIERQQGLAAAAMASLREQGTFLVLANNNHSGLLTSAAATWGAHESYLVDISPRMLGPLLLPFLATRLHAGSGGIQYPTGNFVAGVRAEFMELSMGGDTTHRRAILSTSRDESLMPRIAGSHRLHLISGDGHRSQYNVALQIGTTALALKAIEWDPELPAALSRFQPLPLERSWVAAMREFNRLASPGNPLRIHPLVISVQRVYLEAARRYVAALRDAPPAWIARTLRDWDDTLTAFERVDRDWLAARLDAFTKYELYSSVLEEAGGEWASLPGRESMFYELALLDQGFHEFCNPRSPFQRLEEAGMLEHRVGKRVSAGSEPEPFVPEVHTRAAARGRFIRANVKNDSLFMDWARVVDVNREKEKRLDDPFAVDYSRWRSCEVPEGMLHIVMDC